VNSIAIYTGMFLLAAIFSQINRPRPARKHGYGIKEWVTITILTYVVMVIVFQAAVARWG